MPLWSEVLYEISVSEGAPDDPSIYDAVRLKYLTELSRYTGRDTVLYASSWIQRHDAPPNQTSIDDEDIQALMEVTSELHGPDLDLILHSPGGSPEAAEAIVLYLRSRFQDIRVIVPNLAMSAATMIACSANRIVMGKHSFLGPTDPQFPLQTPNGVRRVSAHAVLENFEKAKKGFTDQAESAIWQLLVSQYGADLIIHCENAIKLSKMLVNSWLQKYMFADCENRKKLAGKISRWLVNHSKFRTHARHLSRERLESKSLVIDALENDKVLQDLSLSVFHAFSITFSRFQVGKIVESHDGKSFIKSYEEGC